MQRRKIKPIHALLMLFAVLIIFSFLGFTMYFEDRLSATDGFCLGILSCFTYGGILFYITGKKDKMTADHDYISIFDKVKNIDNLTSGEVLDKLESLYPKEKPHISSIAHTYFESATMYRANTSNLSSFKAHSMSNFENKLSSYRQMNKK